MTTASPAHPAEQFVTYRALLSLLGGALLALTLVIGGFAVWFMGAVRAEAKVPLAQQEVLAGQLRDLAAKVDKGQAATSAELADVKKLVQAEGLSMRAKVDDLVLMIATGKIQTPTRRAKSEP